MTSQPVGPNGTAPDWLKKDFSSKHTEFGDPLFGQSGTLPMRLRLNRYNGEPGQGGRKRNPQNRDARVTPHCLRIAGVHPSFVRILHNLCEVAQWKIPRTI
jgi:hypothetical protein